MCKCEGTDRKEFVEAVTMGILKSIEPVVKERVDQALEALEVAKSFTDLLESVAEHTHGTTQRDQAAAGIQNGVKTTVVNSVSEFMEAIRKGFEEGQEEELDESETSEDLGEEEEDDGTPTVDITTKNLNPAQQAAVYEFLAKIEAISKKDGDDEKPQKAPKAKEKPAKK